LEKYRTLAQHQLAIRQSRFLGFAVTEMLNRFLGKALTSKPANQQTSKPANYNST